MAKTDIKKVALLLILLTAALYGNTALNGFTYDDTIVVLEDDLIRNWGNFFSVIAEGRGIRGLTFMFDYFLFENEPLGYHLHSIIWQILAVLLAHRVSLKLLKDDRSALIVALLFACHPLHVDAVTSIANRKELLCFVFFMASLLSFIKIHSSGRKGVVAYSAFSALFFLLAYKSKEVAITLPIILFLYEICFISKEERLLLSKRFFYLKITLIITILPLAVWKFIQHIIIDDNIYYFHYQLSGMQLTYSHILYNIVTLFIYYIKNIFFPISLLPDYSVISSELPINTTFIFLLFFFVSYLYLLGFFYMRNRHVFFGLVWLLLNYLIISPLSGMAYPLADRYIYLPSFGASLVMGLAINRGLAVSISRGTQKIYLGAFFICLLCFSILTINYNRYWKSNLTLWEYCLKRNSLSIAGRLNLAVTYVKNNMFDEAESLLMTMSNLDPRDAHYLNKDMIWTDLYYFRGDISDAFDLYRTNEIKLKGAFNSKLAYSHIYNYASALGKHGYVKDALRAYDILLRAGYRKDIVSGKMNYLRNLQGENNRHKIENLKKTIIANSEDIRPRVNLGVLYYKEFYYELAEREFLEALKVNPTSYEAHYDLGLVYKKTKRFEKAAMEFEKVTALGGALPPQVYDNLGLVYVALGRDDDAIKQFSAAINTQSNFALSYKHLGDACRRLGYNAKAISAYKSFLRFWDGDEYYRTLIKSELSDLN